MAQIYVNSVLVQPKAIHIYNSSAQLWEEDKIGYVRVSGSWIPFIEYNKTIYDYGQIKVPLTGLTVGNVDNTITYNADHIQLYAYKTGTTSSASYIHTTEKLDLTEYSTLKVELSTSNMDGIYRIGATATIQTPSNNNGWAAFLQMSGALVSKSVQTVDISALSGAYHIEATAYATSAQAGGARTMKIYKIWLE